MIKEIEMSCAFTKEIQPDKSSVDMIDAYIGCQLQCPYCFQMRDPNWSKDIFVNTNIATMLEQQIGEKNGGDLYIGSMSDPYMELEEKYRLTRKCLEVLSQYDSHVYITTKSDNQLILQDVDVLKSFKKPITVLLGLSNINQADKGDNNINIKVANELKRQGIDVWCFITPILPYIMNVDEMVAALDMNIPIYIDKLRVMTEGNQDKKIYNWIKNKYPQYKDQYEKILFEHDESYYREVMEGFHGDNRIVFMSDMWRV